MAKRLTDTEKWNDDWYLSLNNDYRIIWQWLLDNCNHAGVCKQSMRLLNMMCSTEISESDLLEKMQGRVVVVDNKWFIPKFIKFQYPTLQSHKPVIVSVVNELVKHDLLKYIPESFGNDYRIIKDKEKDKDTVKDKDSLTNGLKNSKNGNSNNGKQFANFKSQAADIYADLISRADTSENNNGGSEDH